MQAFYFVSKRPKGNNRTIYTTAVCLMAAYSRAEAVRKAIERHPEHFGPDSRYSKPQAVLAIDGEVHRF